MREKIELLVENLDLVFLNPIHFPGNWDREGWGQLPLGKVLAFLSALSIAVGSVLVSPPYTQGSMLGILLSTIANFFILLTLPYVLGSFLDYLAQSRDRKGSAQLMVDFVTVAVSIHLLFVPLAFVFLLLGLTGFGAGFAILFLLFVGLGLVLTRGVKYIYDLKDRDALRYSFLSLGLSFFYPFLFNFYMTTGILNLTL